MRTIASLSILLLSAAVLLAATQTPEGARSPVQQPKTQKPSKGKQNPKPGGAAKKPKDARPGVKRSGTKPPKASGSASGKGATTKPRQIPASADPADVRAIRTANQMLAAEKRLKRLLKRGEIDGLDKILTFDEIVSWPYEDGLKGMPKAVRKLDGKRVLMLGFMLPIDEVENIREFLLVQSMWSCHYGQMPDIHGMVRVVMPGKKRTDYAFDPLKIVGTFRVKATVIDGYCVDVFQLDVESLEVLN